VIISAKRIALQPGVALKDQEWNYYSAWQTSKLSRVKRFLLENAKKITFARLARAENGYRSGANCNSPRQLCSIKGL
jgi:hypothetical protein